MSEVANPRSAPALNIFMLLKWNESPALTCLFWHLYILWSYVYTNLAESIKIYFFISKITQFSSLHIIDSQNFESFVCPETLNRFQQRMLNLIYIFSHSGLKKSANVHFFSHGNTIHLESGVLSLFRTKTTCTFLFIITKYLANSAGCTVCKCMTTNT